MARPKQNETRSLMTDALRTRRLEQFGSIRQAEIETGVPRATISRWENGINVPSPVMRQVIKDLWKFRSESDFYC